MARTTTAIIDDTIKNAITDAIRRITPAIQRHVATYAAEQLERNLAVNGTAARRPKSAPRRRRARGEDMTKWVADKAARRVPNFVIEMTGGLDTKRRVIEKYGENATFEKGKPCRSPRRRLRSRASPFSPTCNSPPPRSCSIE
jgi:hypothetical protein